MKNNYNCRIFAVGIIILFVGVSVSPAIAENSNKNITEIKSSIKNKLVDITLETYGNDAKKIHTVQLTQEEVDELMLYLESFNLKISESTSIYEIINIYEELVVELEKYGLLPSGISIKQGQNLIIGPYRNPKFLEYYEKIITKNPPPSSEILNVFCFLSAKYRQDPHTYTGLFFLGVAIYILFDAIGLGESPFFWSLIGIGFIYYLYKPFLFYSLLTSLSPQDPDIYSYGIFGYRHDTSCNDIYGFKGFRIAILNPNSDFRTYFLGHAFVLEYFH